MNPTADPNILALDAAGASCSAALWAGGGLAARRHDAMERGHAEALMPMAVEVVDGTGFAALDLVAVAVGPGAYTGLRIAVAAARGLGLALGIPVLGIGSFDVHCRLARERAIAGPLGIVLETRRADFYFRIFGADDAPVGAPRAATGPEIGDLLAGYGSPVTLAGDAAARLVAETPPPAAGGAVSLQGDASAVAALAADRFASLDADDPAPVRPLYLRPPDTTAPSADRQRLRR